MGDEIANVRTNLTDLLSHVGSSDWQIAMVKAEPYNSCSVEGKIFSTDSNYSAAYTNLLTFNLQGGNEHMLKKARWALEGTGGCDASWLRSGSTVAVIVVTDEPHQCPDSSVCSIANFKSFRNAFAHDIRMYGFTSWTSNTSVFDEHAAVTESDYSSSLQNISSNIQASLKDIFTLSAVPDGVSMTVEVNNSAVSKCSSTVTTNCYKVVSAAGGKAVEFVGYSWSKGDSIEVAYSYGGVAFDQEWTLAHDPLPAANTMTVKVNKANGTSTTLTRGTHYSLSGKVLRVNSASSNVPQGASLRVEYLENKALQTAFTLTDATGKVKTGTDHVPSSVRVKNKRWQWQCREHA